MSLLQTRRLLGDSRFRCSEILHNTQRSTQVESSIAKTFSVERRVTRVSPSVVFTAMQHDVTQKKRHETDDDANVTIKHEHVYCRLH